MELIAEVWSTVLALLTALVALLHPKRATAFAAVADPDYPLQWHLVTPHHPLTSSTTTGPLATT